MHILSDSDIEIREEFQSFVAEIPELPGCSASGITAHEAVENLKFALTELGINYS
jgi:predicted RNase H-like HicB family nuclease